MQSHATMAELRRFAAFIEALRTRGRKDQTLESYESAHRALAAFYFEHGHEPFDLENITGLDLRTLKSVSLELGKSPRTINHRLVFIRQYASWAERKGDVPREQVATLCAVPLLPIAQLGPRVPSPEEFRRFLRYMELQASIRDQAIVSLLLNGLRESEVAGLQLDDVAIRGNQGCVNIQGDHVKGSGTRTVPLTRQARIGLQTYLAGRHDSGPIFRGERGALTVDGIYKIVKRLGRAVGLELHPHTCRRVFARDYHAKNPGDLPGLKLLMGHASLETLVRSYLGKSISDLENGVDKLNQ